MGARFRSSCKSSFSVDDDQLRHLFVSSVRSISVQGLDLRDHCLIYYPCQYPRGSKHPKGLRPVCSMESCRMSLLVA